MRPSNRVKSKMMINPKKIVQKSQKQRKREKVLQVNQIEDDLILKN